MTRMKPSTWPNAEEKIGSNALAVALRSSSRVASGIESANLEPSDHRSGSDILPQRRLETYRKSIPRHFTFRQDIFDRGAEEQLQLESQRKRSLPCSGLHLPACKRDGQ